VPTFVGIIIAIYKVLVINK